jgi:hypothetical protein
MAFPGLWHHINCLNSVSVFPLAPVASPLSCRRATSHPRAFHMCSNQFFVYRLALLFVSTDALMEWIPSTSTSRWRRWAGDCIACAVQAHQDTFSDQIPLQFRNGAKHGKDHLSHGCERPSSVCQAPGVCPCCLKHRDRHIRPQRQNLGFLRTPVTPVAACSGSGRGSSC